MRKAERSKEKLGSLMRWTMNEGRRTRDDGRWTKKDEKLRSLENQKIRAQIED
jgi:hypothetical protein